VGAQPSYEELFSRAAAFWDLYPTRIDASEPIPSAIFTAMAEQGRATLPATFACWNAACFY
jgi:hypothetical protein